MQVWVTVDTGFIGSHSVTALREAGVQEFATRPSTSFDEGYAAPPAHTARIAG